MVMYDVNLSVGRWPFRPLPHETMSELASYLRRFGIGGGLVRAAEGAFSSDPEAENRRLVNRCRKYPEFRPLLIANPFYGCWRKWRRVPAAVLYPGFQGFSLSDAETLAMARGLAARGTRILAVVVREEDERSQHPLCRIPAVPPDALEAFAREVPEATVIALNCCAWETGRFTAPNLYCDTAFAEGFPALAPLAGAIRRGRVLFGSHAPFFCASAGASKIGALAANEQEAIRNAAEKIFREANGGRPGFIETNPSEVLHAD